MSRNLPASTTYKRFGQMDNLEPLRLLHCKVNPGGKGVKMQSGKIELIKKAYFWGF